MIYLLKCIKLRNKKYIHGYNTGSKDQEKMKVVNYVVTYCKQCLHLDDKSGKKNPSLYVHNQCTSLRYHYMPHHPTK